MISHIQLKLYATLQIYTPPDGQEYPVAPGTTMRALLEKLNVPEEKAKLLFINGARADLSSTLQGGERVGIFPPVGGG